MDKAMHSEFEGHKSRLEKDSEIWVFSHAHDVFGISAQEAYIAGATREILNNSEENQSLRSELQKQKELNAELVKGLGYIKKLLGTLSVAQDTTEGQAYYTAESLIKKSKES